MECEIKVKVKYGWLYARGYAKMYVCTNSTGCRRNSNWETDLNTNTSQVPNITPEGFKALLQLSIFTLGPDATLNTEIHKNSVRIKAPNSVNALKRKKKKKKKKSNQSL